MSHDHTLARREVLDSGAHPGYLTDDLVPEHGRTWRGSA
jgi:hypothetical protein